MSTELYTIEDLWKPELAGRLELQSSLADRVVFIPYFINDIEEKAIGLSFRHHRKSYAKVVCFSLRGRKIWNKVDIRENPRLIGDSENRRIMKKLEWKRDIQLNEFSKGKSKEEILSYKSKKNKPVIRVKGDKILSIDSLARSNSNA